MESRQKTSQDNQPDSVPTGEVEAAKKVINTLLVAVKNACLYPEEHAVCQQSISHVFTRIMTFTSDYGDLKITVKDNCFLYEGREIYQGPEDSSNLAYMFFRDGILWLEFQQGLKAEEIKELFQLINRYKNPQEEAEGDLVTALWEADFAHISYAAADISLDSSFFLNFPQFRINYDAGQEEPQIEIAAGTGMDNSAIHANQKDHGRQTQTQPKSKHLNTDVPLLQVERHLWKLTAKEEAILQHMIAAEEQRAQLGTVFDVLISILKIQTDEADFVAILTFLQTEFKEALFLQQFSAILHLLQSLRSMYSQANPDKKWVCPLIARFFTAVSSPPTLEVLVQIWPELSGQNPEQQSLFIQICRQLTPAANQTFIPLLSRKKVGQLQQQLEKIVRQLASRYFSSLTPLLDNQDELVTLKLIDIISGINDSQSTRMLLKLAKHPHSLVRKEAIKILLERETTLLPKLIYCLDDDYEAIRLMMLHHIGRERHQLPEQLLLEYFANHPFHADESNHLLACYKALGRCGSDSCIPFLKKMIWKHGWYAFGGLNKNYRKGAAMALALLKTEQADHLLAKGARSFHPQIRLSCREAREQKQ
ncbi:MAG: hypothetical protein GWP07_01945 [Xanthomonadaceae bacterium]|nr:hypothetical protein [Xanthomonadaceae bacterium]